MEAGIGGGAGAAGAAAAAIKQVSDGMEKGAGALTGRDKNEMIQYDISTGSSKSTDSEDSDSDNGDDDEAELWHEPLGLPMYLLNMTSVQSKDKKKRKSTNDMSNEESAAAAAASAVESNSPKVARK